MGAIDISMESLSLCLVLLIFPLIVDRFLHLKLLKPLIISVIRMIGQLALVGIFLEQIFILNNPFLNIGWFLLMILTAVITSVRNSKMKANTILIPAFFSFLTAAGTVIFYINFFVIKIENLFDARYIIVLSGMLLGNILRANVIGINNFYNSIKKEKTHFHYILSLGAGRFEAVLPYLRESLTLALKPTIASMATMGIVALPGMMTGNILGGTSPMVAIKYQIMIMIAIFVCTNLSVLFTILSTLNITFTPYGTLRQDIFIGKK